MRPHLRKRVILFGVARLVALALVAAVDGPCQDYAAETDDALADLEEIEEIDGLEDERDSDRFFAEERGASKARVGLMWASVDFMREIQRALEKRVLNATAPMPSPMQSVAEPRYQPGTSRTTQTSQYTEPKSIWLQSAPPPGKPSQARVLQLRVLNVAARNALPGGGFEAGFRSVDFLLEDDLTYLARVNLDEGLPTSFYEPSGMASSADGRRLVVGSRGSDVDFFPANPVANHLTVIDAVAGRIEKRILLGDLWPVSLALSPDGSTAYVSASGLTPGGVLTGERTVLFVDLASGAIVQRVNLPGTAGGGATGEIVITPDGALLFVFGGGLHQVDVRSATVTARIDPRVGSRRILSDATEIAMHPHGTKLYVADAQAPQSADDFTTVGFAVIDVATLNLDRVVPVPGAVARGSADDIAAIGAGNIVAHFDGVSGMLSFFDALTYALISQSDEGDALFEANFARWN